MSKNYNRIIFLCLLLFGTLRGNAQLYNDGPIRLRVWAYKVWSSANCGEIGDQEYAIKNIQARVDNGGGAYITSPSGLNIAFNGSENRYYSLTNPGAQYSAGTSLAGLPQGANGVQLLNITYSTAQVPYSFQVTFGQSFEEDCQGDFLSCGQGNTLNFDQCCCVSIPFVGTVCASSDDYDAYGAWTNVNFRAGEPGVVNYTQPLIATANGEHKYAVIYAYQWDWLEMKPLCPSPKYKDGNHTVTCDLVGVFSDLDWDQGTCGVSIGGDEDIRVKVKAKDNLTPAFTPFSTGAGTSIRISQSVPGWNTSAAGGGYSLPYNVFNKTYTTEQNDSMINIAWDLWEEDGFNISIFGFGFNCGTEDQYEGSDGVGAWYCQFINDDAHATTIPPDINGKFNYATVPNTGYTINWRNSPENTDNYIDVPVRIGSSGFQNWMLRFKYKWTMASPASISVDKADDLTLCTSAPVSSYTYTATVSQATFYQWQVANVSGGAPPACPSGAGVTWTNIAGANCSVYIPPATPGTRIYRCIAYNRTGTGSVSAAGPKYDSIISTCKRLTFLPYAPPIISVACNASTFQNVNNVFTATQPPAIAGLGGSGWSYAWSNTGGATVTGGSVSGPSVTYAFPNTGSFTVTLTIINALGCASASTSCPVNVSTPSCDQLFVHPTLGSDANPGTATQPYQTITYALSKVSGSRNHIHVLGGATYNETQWTIPANAIIDGGWEVVGALANGDWRKNSSLTTTANLNPGLENDGTQGFYRGIVGGGNNFLVQDLTVNVKNGVNQPNVTSTQFNNKGITIYGAYIADKTGWEFKRITLNTGNGTNGAANSSQPAGSGGNSAGTVGSGGARGGGSSVECGCGSGDGSVTFSNGGAGTDASTSSGGTWGAGGQGRGATTVGARCCGSGCNIVNCNESGCTAGNGSPGRDGATGTTGATGAAPGLGGPFFQPGSQGATGGGGGHGGGGSGGGGADIGTECTCSNNNDRPYGGAGGAGGRGGAGGPGGYAGGGTFGIYAYKSTAGSCSGTLTSSTIAAGTVGVGGLGAPGQAGAAGAVGESGFVETGSCSPRGIGGNGGKGGDGGQGGTGGQGAPGVANNYVAVNGATLTTTNISLTPVAPNATADYLKARFVGGPKGCTRSFIEIEKANGSSPPSSLFDLVAMGATLINDESPNTSTYTNNTGALTTQVEFSTAGWKQEKLVGQNAWTTFINVLEDRATLPLITTNPKRICANETTTFTITGNSPNQDFTGAAADYEWRYRLYKQNTTRTVVGAWTSGTGAGPNTIGPLANATTDSLTYLISARVRDKCCGWSRWVYDSVVVMPAINPHTSWAVCGIPAAPANGSSVCIKDPRPLCVNIPTGGSGPAWSQTQYRYSTDGGTTWTAWSTTRPTNITKIIGNTIVQSIITYPSTVSVNGLDNCDTAYTTTQISWAIDDSVTADAAITNISSCGSPNASAELTSATPSSGTGTWTQVSAPGGVTVSPALPTSANTITVSNIPWGTGTSVYQWLVVNGSCRDSVSRTVAVANNNTNAITLDTLACYTCPLVDGNTYTYFDVTGRIVCKIEDLTGPVYSTASLANTEVCIRRPTPPSPLITPSVYTNVGGNLQPYLKRYWSIKPEVAGTGIFAKVTLYFIASEYSNLFSAAVGTPYQFASVNDLMVSKFPGGGGMAFDGPNNILSNNTTLNGENIVTNGYSNTHPNWVGAAFSSYNSDYQVEFTIDQFSTFYVHPVRFPYEVLPVELVSFTGTNVGDKNRLDWVTASEINTQKFIVEKSLDAVNWFYLGEKPAAGNSSARLTYNLFDNTPVVGHNYYRLKIVDLDGSYKYSNIVDILTGNTAVNGIIGAYPNPTSKEFTVIVGSSTDYKSTVKIYDILGQVIKTTSVNISAGINMPSFDFSDLSAATYVISLTDATGKEERLKFVKQ